MKKFIVWLRGLFIKRKERFNLEGLDIPKPKGLKKEKVTIYRTLKGNQKQTKRKVNIYYNTRLDRVNEIERKTLLYERGLL